MINARIFSRKGTEKDERARAIEDQERAKLERTRDEEVKILRDSFFRKIRGVLSGKTTTAKLVDDKGKVLLAKGAQLDDAALDEVPRKYWGEIRDPAAVRRTSSSFWRTSKSGSVTARSTSRTRSSASRAATSCRPASSRW